MALTRTRTGLEKLRTALGFHLTARSDCFPIEVDTGGAKRLFTATPLQKHGGKVDQQKQTAAAAAAATTPQKSSTGKITSRPPPSAQAETGGMSGAPPPPPTKQTSKYLIYVGVFSAAVVAALVIYPVDLLKNIYPGQKDLPKASEQTKALLDNLAIKQEKEETEEHDAMPLKDKEDGSVETKEKNSALPIDHPTRKDEDVQETTDTGSVDYLLKKERHINISSDQKVESMPDVDVAFVQKEKPAPAEISNVLEEGNREDSKIESSSPKASIQGALEDQGTLPDESSSQYGLFVEPQEKAIKLKKTRPELSKAYYLPMDGEKGINVLEGHWSKESEALPEQEASLSPSISKEESGDAKHHETVRDAFDFLELLHAAEQRQAELDARLHQEDQRKMKDFYERELKDAQAKEMMYAEEADRLAKEVSEEKERAAAELKLQHKIAQERLEKELKWQEEEASLGRKKAMLLGKTEMAAAVAAEKAAYLKDIKEVNLQLEGLHMAFYTRSEEARQSHTLHKLAVGTFAIEDAMKRGTSVEKEIALLRSAAVSGSDPLLDAAIDSLSNEIVKEGTRTPAQLHQKFEEMKGALRELSLMPAVGGGLLSHAAAKVISGLKVRETGQFTGGIEAVISQVQKYLADGNLACAADSLENGVQGTKAEAFIVDWVKHARDRAAMEQVLVLLQAHATAVVSSLV